LPVASLRAIHVGQKRWHGQVERMAAGLNCR